MQGQVRGRTRRRIPNPARAYLVSVQEAYPMLKIQMKSGNIETRGGVVRAKNQSTGEGSLDESMGQPLSR